MLSIQGISADPKQKFNLILPDGSQFQMEIYYRAQQFGWFITKLVYGDFVLNELRITNNPNMLYQWQNLIPFGLACFTLSNREPTQVQDFDSGDSNLYVLTQAEVLEYTRYIENG